MMRPGHLLFSGVQFIFVAMLFLLGGLFIALEYTPSFRASLAALIIDYPAILSFFGWVVVGCSILLALGFYVMYRGSYYHVQMDRAQVSIDSKVVEELVQVYWKQRFPEKEFKVQVFLRGKREIEVLAEMPGMELEAQSVLLTEVEFELGALLDHHLGHSREWLMTILATR